MDQCQPVLSKMNITDFSPELLRRILSHLPQQDLKRNVPLVCELWRDLARSLQTSLQIPIDLDDTFGTNKFVTPEKISEVLKKTTRLEKLEIANILLASETNIDFLSSLLVSQLKAIIEMWRQNFPESLSSFTTTFKNVNVLVPLDDRIHFENAVRFYFQIISGLLSFQFEAISVNEKDVRAEFCKSHTGSNFKKGFSLTMDDFHRSVALGRFLNFSRDNLQKIELQSCDLSRDNMQTLKTLPSLKDLSLCATENLEDFKFLFDQSCKLRELEFLEVDMVLDAEAVRNVGNCCGNSLRYLSIRSHAFWDSNVAEQQQDEWVACLNSFRALEALKLCRVTMSPERWASIFGRDGALKNLKSLELSYVGTLSPSTFAKIAEFSGNTLKTLDVFSSTGSTPLDSPKDWAEHVRRLHALEELECGFFENFENYTDQTQFLDTLFGTGSQLTRLTSLCLSNEIYLDESWISALENCCGKNLKTLDMLLEDRETPNASPSRLKHFSKLEVLRIVGYAGRDSCFSSADWSSLFDGQSELSNLRDVTLWFNENVDDDCIRNLAKLCGKNLKELDIRECRKVTESGINVVKEMCGSDLKLLLRYDDDDPDDDDDGGDDDDNDGGNDDGDDDDSDDGGSCDDDDDDDSGGSCDDDDDDDSGGSCDDDDGDDYGGSCDNDFDGDGASGGSCDNDDGDNDDGGSRDYGDDNDDKIKTNRAS